MTYGFQRCGKRFYGMNLIDREVWEGYNQARKLPKGGVHYEKTQNHINI